MPRTTHFLALPLGHHPALRHSVAALQSALLHIPGIDNSTIIDPRRLHLTLGVMDLDRSLRAALALLTSLKPRITHILAGEPLRVDLNSLDIMGNDVHNAHVLWLGPTPASDDARRLRAVCDLIHDSFKDAGFIRDNRPLKLHCTVINTSHRKPRRPFSYPAVLAALANPSSSICLGTWDVDEVQICKMGSHGPQNQYVSSGGIALP